jgi:hypothetical protein
MGAIVRRIAGFRVNIETASKNKGIDGGIILKFASVSGTEHSVG